MTRPRSLRRFAQLTRLHGAQEGRCYLCGEEMSPEHFHDKKRGWSGDHVHPRTRGNHRTNNILLAHRGCNGRKGSRVPRPCEVLFLVAMNLKLGFAA